MPLAGELGVAPYYVTATRTTTSGTFTTTETFTDAIAVNLINGKTYAVECCLLAASSTGGDECAWNLREDSATGTGLNGCRVYLQAANHGYLVRLYSEYVAVATSTKTFVASGVRTSGGGNVSSPAGANTPAYLFVRRII